MQEPAVRMPLPALTDTQIHTFCILPKLPAPRQWTAPEPHSAVPEQTGAFCMNEVSVESWSSVRWREVLAVRAGGLERSLPCQCLTRKAF